MYATSPTHHHSSHAVSDRTVSSLDVTASRSRLDLSAADIVVLGAPGAVLVHGKLKISRAARERAELAARYWLSLPQQARPVRVICVAGRPAFRSGMPKLPSSESEAPKMIDIMLRLGVHNDVIRPNQEFPLDRDFSTSTVDEVSILVGTQLISPEQYSREAPLCIVLHRRHGARAIDILRKVGFERSHLLLLSPKTLDPKREIAIRLAYRILVIGSSRRVAPEVLQRRERRLVTIRRLHRRLFCSRGVRPDN